MRLLICDDEKFITEQMVEMCERYYDEELPGLEFLAVNDFADKEDFEADVIFLDVEMPGKNGILIKDELEATENEALIILSQITWKMFFRIRKKTSSDSSRNHSNINSSVN